MQNASAIFGYARVSIDAQDLTSQLAPLRAAGRETIFHEKITGATRPGMHLKFGNSPEWPGRMSL
jgi:DNA invertase Pin-like site-specific DNA recombinase